MRDHGIPTILPNDFHQIGQDIQTDHGNNVSTHVLVGSDITDWVEDHLMSRGEKKDYKLAYQMLASTVQCIYMQYGADAVRGLFMDYFSFAAAAQLEFAMVNDAYQLCLAYEGGLTFGGEVLAEEESLLVGGALNVLANNRVKNLSEKHRDLLWRLPRTEHGLVLSEYGVPYADPNQSRLRTIKPHFEAFEALLSDTTS